MDTEKEAVLVDEQPLSVDQLSLYCRVSREWVIEHVQAGVLEVHGSVEQWTFTSPQLQRARRLLETETRFDANPELAGLVVDLVDELSRLRRQLRRSR